MCFGGLEWLKKCNDIHAWHFRIGPMNWRGTGRTVGLEGDISQSVEPVKILQIRKGVWGGAAMNGGRCVTW